MECEYGILNIKKFAYMATASILLIVGDVLITQHRDLGILIIISAWLLIAYNLWLLMPDKSHQFLPVIAGLCITGIILPYSEYAFIIYVGLWVGLGYLLSSNFGPKWIGPVLGLLISSAYTLLLPWQRKYNMVDGLAYPLMTAGLISFSALYSLPTRASLEKNAIPCLDKILGMTNLDSKYIDSINCVLESGCFESLRNIDLTDPTIYVPEIVDAIACAGTKCNIYSTISGDIDCFIKQCLPTILKTPPATPFAWATAIMGSYVSCGIPNCKFPGIN